MTEMCSVEFQFYNTNMLFSSYTFNCFIINLKKILLFQEILDILQDPELKNKKESCSCLNLIIQFLFRELKDTHMIRRYIIFPKYLWFLFYCWKIYKHLALILATSPLKECGSNSKCRSLILGAFTPVKVKPLLISRSLLNAVVAEIF